MLRFLVLALLLGNGLYFAWSQGLLQTYGFAPQSQSEPQRLAQQLHPQTLRLLSAQESAATEVPQRTSELPAVCLQAGLFDPAQTAQLRDALDAALPVDSWVLDEVREPVRWIVYMGPYPNADALAKKRTELAFLKLRFESLSSPALQGGLSLGRFETQSAADAQLKTLGQRGVRTARVLQEGAELRGTRLRLPLADAALRARMEALTPVLAGKTLSPCD